MKVSVSLAEEDVAFLDQYVAENAAASRSAAVQEAVHLLRLSALEEAYAEAFAEWEGTEDAELWDSVSGDGLDDDDL